jgi:hypothetical protein
MTETPLSAREALTRLGGVAADRDVIRLSSRRRLRTAIRRNEIHRLNGRDRVCLASSDRAHRAARSYGGTLSHASAALHHGWAVANVPDLPQLIMIPGTDPPLEPLELADTHPRHLDACEITDWATSPIRTVIDCARDLPFTEALAIADSALRSEDVSADGLIAACRGMRGPAGDRVRRVAAYANGLAANPFESETRALCLDAGLEVVPQYEVTTQGLTIHPDMANPLVGVIVEADSYTHHGMEAKAFTKDLVRYNALVAAGWRVLRFNWEQVHLNPAYVTRTIRALLVELAA